MRLVPLALLGLLAFPLRAQTPDPCAHGAATARLNVGGVDAGLFNNGNLFYSSGTVSAEADYTVGGGTGLYAANFWVGGTVDSDVRTASATFQNFEFWPGPLDAGATLPAQGCAAFDRIYSVTRADVTAYETTGVATPDLAAWPVGLGADAVDATGQRVVPTSRSQTINLGAGQRPVVYGSQTAFWVMNDKGGAHAWTGSAPLGIEVQVTAVAFSGQGAVLDQSTAYRYRIVNRSAVAITDAHASLWVDTDLGGLANEYQGVDVARGLAFTYNPNVPDPQYGVPPALGYDFLNTGIGAHRHAYNGASTSTTGDPRSLQQVSNAQRGLWNNGTPLTTSGTGYQTPGAVTRFAFPADPVTGQAWSEVNADGMGTANLPGNKRSITTTPAFTLAPGAKTDVHIAIVFAQGTSHLDSVTRLYAASDVVQAAFDSGTVFPAAGEPDAPASASGASLAALRPNPTTRGAETTLTLPADAAVRVSVVDVLGREVAVVYDGTLPAGAHPLRLPAGLAPGIYAVVAATAEARLTERLTVTR